MTVKGTRAHLHHAHLKGLGEQEGELGFACSRRAIDQDIDADFLTRQALGEVSLDEGHAGLDVVVVFVV